MKIRIGAFSFTGKNKQRLLLEAVLYFNQAKAGNKLSGLFDTEPSEYPLPVLSRSDIEDTFDELELLGFPLCDPFKLLSSTNRGDGIARELLQKVGNQVHIVG